MADAVIASRWVENSLGVMFPSQDSDNASTIPSTADVDMSGSVDGRRLVAYVLYSSFKQYPEVGRKSLYLLCIH